MYTVKLSRQAVKDSERVRAAGLGSRAGALIEILRKNPFQNPPPYEKLSGDLSGYYSRRLNRQHRLIYSVHEAERIVAIRRMWTHYE